MAASAPSSISTNPKPRDRPVSRSEITCARATVPYGENTSRRSSAVVLKGRFPTYKFLLIIILCEPCRLHQKPDYPPAAVLRRQRSGRTPPQDAGVVRG